MRIRNAPTEQLEEAILVAKGERDEASVLLMKAEGKPNITS